MCPPDEKRTTSSADPLAIVASSSPRITYPLARASKLGQKLGVATLASSTNFVCFRLGSRAEAEALVAALLERGIFVRKPGAPPIDDCIRVTIGTPGERAAFGDAFAEALDALREKATR